MRDTFYVVKAGARRVFETYENARSTANMWKTQYNTGPFEIVKVITQETDVKCNSPDKETTAPACPTSIPFEGGTPEYTIYNKLVDLLHVQSNYHNGLTVAQEAHATATARVDAYRKAIKKLTGKKSPI